MKKLAFERGQSQKAIKFFFITAFVLPWTGWLTMIFTGFNYFLFYTAAFCSLGGLFALYLEGGVSALRRLFQRMKSGWKGQNLIYLFLVPVVWQIGSLFIYITMTSAEGAMEMRWEGLLGIFSLHTLWLLSTGPISEEFGWRTYFFPWLLDRLSFVKSAIVLGVIWALWHWPIMLSKWTDEPVTMIYFIVGVICFSFWIGLLYLKSGGNVLLCIALHWFINSVQEHDFINQIFPSLKITSSSFTVTQVSFALLMTIVLWYNHRNILQEEVIKTTLKISNV